MEENEEKIIEPSVEWEEGGKSVMIEVFGSSPKTRIIDFYMDNKIFDFTKKEVIEDLGMSKKTFYKYFPEIRNMGIVKPTRKIGRAQLYKLNLNNTIVKKIIELEREVSDEYAEEKLEKMKKREEEELTEKHVEKMNKKEKIVA